MAHSQNLGWFESHRWLPKHIISGLSNGARSGLGIQINLSAGTVTASTTAFTKGTTAEQRLKTFDQQRDGGLMQSINRELAGERDYPIVGKIAGSVIGKLGIDFAAAFYSAASSMVGPTEKSSHVFVRDKDEIWRMGAIGKAGRPDNAVPTYVATYLLVDPFRTVSGRGVWNLHEERLPLVG